MSKGFHNDNSNEIRTLIRTGDISHGTYQRKRSKLLELRVKRGIGKTGATYAIDYLLQWGEEQEGNGY